MSLAARVDLQPRIEEFELTRANEALRRLKHGELSGAAVIIPSQFKEVYH
jgi:D-arabinose 1-dehydrogenase-like Zn-dependent alcohol dehydrogenase